MIDKPKLRDRRLAPGQECSRLLQPLHGIGNSQASPFRWHSQGEDPQFTVASGPVGLKQGWYLIEVTIRTDGHEDLAKWYFDYGEGYSETHVAGLPYRSGVTASRLHFLEGAPLGIRFDPMERGGLFSVDHMSFLAMQPMHARNHMIRTLTRAHAYYQGRSVGLVWQQVRQQAETRQLSVRALLYSLYRGIFVLNTQDEPGLYARWIDTFETPEVTDASASGAVLDSWRTRPTISIIMPTYNSDERYLREAIESVLAQDYPHWELCVADDASTDAHVREIIDDYARRDRRIKATFRATNGRIAAASNTALELARGDYVALLDHDDTLAPNALHALARAIQAQPDVQILYTDEDKIDPFGVRSSPHFKPDWNPDLLLSQNYMGHLTVFRRALLQRVGGFREGVEGSQDHDLVLRCMSHIGARPVVHVAKVLYHWRMSQGSTALAPEAKDYTTRAGLKALQDYFTAQGRDDVRVEAGLLPNTYRARYPIPAQAPLVSVLIPTRDNRAFLEPCIRSILATTEYHNYEIIILDNESVEAATLAFFRDIQQESEKVRVEAFPCVFNFSAICNYGVTQARGDLIALVNNDIEVISPDWLTEMVGHALRPEIGCVGAKLYYGDDTIQHAGVILGIGGVAGHSHRYFPHYAHGYFARLRLVQNLSAVTAACLVVRKSVYEAVGGMEENGLDHSFNDVDFCLKVREAGYRNLWTPHAELYHYESKSRGAEDTPERVMRFNKECDFMKRKWGDLLQKDPYYNPNLTMEREDFSLRIC